MTAIKSFRPTIWPSGTRRDDGSMDLEAPGKAEEEAADGGFCEA